MKLQLTFVGLLLVAAAVVFPSEAQETRSPREQLTQDVADLQKNPSDDALREKIIKLALTLDPKPAIPEEAVTNAAKGKTIFAAAAKGGTPEDLKVAAAAFAQASQLAPWVPDYYYDEGLALEGAKQYDDAIRALNFYLLAAPNAPDAADVRGKIEGIKYEKDTAARQTQQQEEQRAQQAQAAAEQQRQFAAELMGSWKHTDGTGGTFTYSLAADGSGVLHLTFNGYYGRGSASVQNRKEEYVGKLIGTSFSGTWQSSDRVDEFLSRLCGDRVGSWHSESGSFSGSLSADGQTLTIDRSGNMQMASCSWQYRTDHKVFNKE